MFCNTKEGKRKTIPKCVKKLECHFGMERCMELQGLPSMFDDSSIQWQLQSKTCRVPSFLTPGWPLAVVS